MLFLLNCDVVKKRLPDERKNLDTEQPQAIVTAVPVSKRTAIRELEKETEVPKSTLYDSLKKGAIVGCTTTLKPLLTVKMKMERMKFILALFVKIQTKIPFFFIICTIWFL